MKEINGCRILITGGAGFIGSNLAKSLVNNNDIVIVDDLSMGRIENLPQSPHLHFFKHTITDSEFMDHLLTGWKFDYIFLLAAVASVADTIKRPFETHEINQEANIHILEIIRKKNIKIKKLLFTSSAAVYGNNPKLPKSENSFIDPLSPYAIDKFATERFVINYGKLYNIPTIATRFFNVYGPRQNPNSPYSGVLSIISKDIRENKTFTIFGNGGQTRDYIYIKDVITAIEIIMTKKSAVHEVYNVATGKSISLNEVIRVFERVCNLKINITRTDSRIGDIKRSVADITKIKSWGFIPKYSLERGIREYLSQIER